MHASTAEIIQRSHNRCVQTHRLDPAGRLPDLLTARELAERRQRFDHVVGEALGSVEGLRGVIEDSRCALLVSNQEGVIVRRMGQSTEASALGRAIEVGSVWSEEQAGTNGVGTALSEGAAVTVVGTDHLLEALHPFTCTTAPLLDADQQVVGAIDLTAWLASRPDLPFLRHVVDRVASEVHCRLFARDHADHLLVGLSRERPTAVTAAHALVAIGRDGTIRGVSGPARRLLAKLDRTLVDRATTGIGQLLQERVGLDLAALADSPIGTVSRALSLYARVVRTPAVERRSRVRSTPARRSRPGPPTPRDLAGTDPRMLRHVRLIERVQDTGLPFLLLGETGVGKDALAKAIHATSARSHKPFVAVNCASLPESLLDSELFGYAPGTFTGGLREGKRGKIAASHRGTLFLDEIGDMPLALQGRLLRVLAEGEVTRLGAVEPEPVDVQIISATNHDLEGLVADGRFRADLFYRLSGATFQLPPLRERADLDDIVHRLLAREHGETLGIHPTALACLRAYRWPGNIRQLAQVLRFAAACADGDHITLDDLPERVRGVPPTERAPVAKTLDQTVAQSERAALMAALEHASWNVSQAAERLGIGRTTIHRKMRALGITRPEH